MSPLSLLAWGSALWSGSALVRVLVGAAAACGLVGAVWAHSYATASARCRAAALAAELADAQEANRRINRVLVFEREAARSLAEIGRVAQIRLQEFDRASPPAPAACRDADRLTAGQRDALRRLRGESTPGARRRSAAP